MIARGGEKGAVLIITIIFASMLAAFVAAALREGAEKAREADLSMQVTQGLLLAEAAVDAAAVANSGDIGSEGEAIPFGDDSYWAEVETLVASDPVLGTGAIVKITGHGQPSSGPVRDEAGVASMVTHVEMVVQYPPPGSNPYQPFQSLAYGGSGDTPVAVMGNAETDSFDSEDGAYGGANVGDDGDMGSNYGLDMDGDATINGEVFAAGDYGLQMTGESVVTGDVHAKDSNVTTSGGAEVQGTIDGNVSAQSLPSVVDKGPDFLADNDNASNIGGLTSISVGGGPGTSFTLPSGTYYFESISVTRDLIIEAPCEIYVSGSCNVTGNGAITISGGNDTNHVEMYVAAGALIAGNGVAGGQASDFLIYSHGTDEIKVAGNGSSMASVYAPNAPVKIAGNGTFWGAFVADTVTVEGNADIHYDEALSSISVDTQPPAGGAGTYSVLVWRRIR